MTGLVERGDSLLLVIDAQPAFNAPLTDDHASPAQGPLLRVAWLAAVAAALDIPIIVTEEDAERNGATAAPILAAAPGTAVLAKHVFGAADQPDILAAIEAVGRGTIVIVGMETDVCVAHSAIGLVGRGHRVVVVADATSSPGPMHDAGIRRMAGLGVEVVHAKGIYYEWIRTLDAARAFERDHPELADPPGFRL